MHVIPPNGFPNVPSFADLDAIAKQIENMPTFTSNDRAFLEELPAFPIEDGIKVLTATTESGETVLSWETVDSGIILSDVETPIGSILGNTLFSKIITPTAYTLSDSFTDTGLTISGIEKCVLSFGYNVNQCFPIEIEVRTGGAIFARYGGGAFSPTNIVFIYTKTT